MSRMDAPYLITLEWQELCAILAITAVFIQRVKNDPVLDQHVGTRALKRAQKKLAVYAS